MNYTDNGDGTITDNNTKLVWEKKSADGTIHDQNATYNWSDAFAVHLAGLNASNFAGHSDWRLPSISELQSILNYAVSNPSVSPVFNTNCAPGATVLTGSCTQSGVASFYWTSTAVASNPAAAWIICFGGADSALGSNPGNKIAPLYVRAVRGGSPRYTDKGDGTILDNHTKLVWEKKSADGSIHDKELTYTWYDAFAVHVAGLNAAGFAGHNDWRLPNERELENIIEYEKADPAIPLVFNVNCSSGTTVLTGSCTAATPAVYWSSTTDALNAGEAWIVQPDSGLQTTTDKRIPFHVRAVRTGP